MPSWPTYGFTSFLISSNTSTQLPRSSCTLRIRRWDWGFGWLGWPGWYCWLWGAWWAWVSFCSPADNVQITTSTPLRSAHKRWMLEGASRIPEISETVSWQRRCAFRAMERAPAVMLRGSGILGGYSGSATLCEGGGFGGRKEGSEVWWWRGRERRGGSAAEGQPHGEDKRNGKLCAQCGGEAVRGSLNSPFTYIEQIDYDPITHRIRCLDHILNLALQAFLLATSKEALKAALAAIEETEDTDPYELFSAYLDVPVVEDNPASIRAHEQAQRRGSKVKAKHKGFEGWGATTALQKLHNLAVWLRNSSIHHDRWIEAVGITLGIDNDTRWSSWYHLIKRTTRKEREIKDFIDKHPECDNFRLNGVEWDTLKRTEKFLSVFASGTLWVEGSEASLSQSLTLMDAILTFFEDQKFISSVKAFLSLLAVAEAEDLDYVQSKLLPHKLSFHCSPPAMPARETPQADPNESPPTEDAQPSDALPAMGGWQSRPAGSAPRLTTPETADSRDLFVKYTTLEDRPSSHKQVTSVNTEIPDRGEDTNMAPTAACSIPHSLTLPTSKNTNDALTTAAEPANSTMSNVAEASPSQTSSNWSISPVLDDPVRLRMARIFLYHYFEQKRLDIQKDPDLANLLSQGKDRSSVVLDIILKDIYGRHDKQISLRVREQRRDSLKWHKRLGKRWSILAAHLGIGILVTCSKSLETRM
ncbi:hypothetical protein K469DRAFT_753136 [Zopfia rhizophila CBS 207.26]|uniref:Uncharacterized protein n=1 Tax=Zopfia rhizophila CBS 207.26 TaxID=1314779 RepID=A0A6A6DP35_9PEZI|nr:hypothetical protein K469DRAFT_753136 [Zopfia rhizophila CBS 207.26]